MPVEVALAMAVLVFALFVGWAFVMASDAAARKRVMWMPFIWLAIVIVGSIAFVLLILVCDSVLKSDMVRGWVEGMRDLHRLRP